MKYDLINVNISSALTLLVPGQVPGTGHTHCGIGQGIGPAGVPVKRPVAHHTWRADINVTFSESLHAVTCNLRSTQCFLTALWLTLLPVERGSAAYLSSVLLCSYFWNIHLCTSSIFPSSFWGIQQMTPVKSNQAKVNSIYVSIPYYYAHFEISHILLEIKHKN